MLHKHVLAAAIALSLFACVPPRAVAPTPAPNPVCRECRAIEHRLVGKNSNRLIRGDTLQMSKTSAKFYRNRSFEPAWSVAGQFLPRADALIHALQAADWEGLNPVEYHLRALEGAKRKWPKVPTLELTADMDVLLTDAYLLYASHLLGGRTNVGTAKAQWNIIRKKADPVDLLNQALQTDEIPESFRALTPPYDGYARLKAGLSRYRVIARGGGWPVIPDGPLVKPGATDERIPLLRERLAIEAGVPVESTASKKLDHALQKQVKEFQRSHGIEGDGRLGADTLAALNVTVDERINQIKFSMDRWRWLPFDLGHRYIVVNIPEFRLTAKDESKPTLFMPVIVGKNDDETATPEFSNMLTYLEFSPEWNVPNRIATQEMLPTLQADTTYLTRNHLEVLTRSGEAWEPTDASKIVWSSVTATGFPYRIRQRPGPWNALGGVKFMFPNEYSVYIHGNADEGLFDKRLRTFSHGCVRVSDPTKLARWVMNDADWTPERVKQYMRQPQPVIVPLGEIIPVYLVYWTAFVDGSGVVNFREDIYGRDRQMRDRFYPEQAAREPVTPPTP